MRRGWPLALGVIHCQSRSSERRPRVAVVGAGLTGCLTAAMLRRDGGPWMLSVYATSVHSLLNPKP